MIIAVGSDHAGYGLKTEIIDHLKQNGYEVLDFGTCDCNSVDYPDYGLSVAEAVKDGRCEKGIIICGTGIGISIAANKVPGIRAAVCSDTYSARMSREHNNANVLSIGARVVGPGLALDIVDTWLKAEFQGGKHQNRINKITQIEKKYLK
ncbi:ribose 5-phosphate isomerase B [Clostridium thermosuccinogenes]|mgnify:FL=1|uniref:Ribose 5-phosphate isomerase B n=1 Tax=Clostridium thermosuccinogenes TaxID=84032 RepID=A0A2K2FJF9_9CLOT|nr:ribose 5-phosphate isomerase B [Pseudoclostridium thermosuccinogenes]AUS98401.1 ribose 5-phosphate isomerase B [Pseudoclostridium thermosuccinogenes]PNT98919.1 ribose 5-phosphate isomerase B [Pseudoclostridium thermosuccinogenes]PNU00834.1 ribose 5-phosphate isomerase B [Pseudoclostridium thermosuccinogenes]